MKTTLWYIAGGAWLLLGLVALVAGTNMLLQGHWLDAILAAALIGCFASDAARCKYRGTGTPVPAPLERWHQRLWTLAVAVAAVRIAVTI